MKVYWTNFASKKLQAVFDYYKEVAGKRVADKIIKGIIKYTYNLEKNQKIGSIETFLKTNSIEYRYLIYKNYKIIYWVIIEKNRIEIIHIFDCRQDPEKLNQFNK